MSLFRTTSVALLLVLTSISAVAADPEQDWLTGTWALCEDPDHGVMDMLQFNSDGTGIVIRAKGNVRFIHKHSGHSVSLMATLNRVPIPIDLTASVQFDKLQLINEKTGNTSFYVRSERTAEFKCSMK